MASIPTQEDFLAATRKSQEAMIAAIRTWLEAVRTASPKLTSVYTPLTGPLPKLPLVSLPFADKLPTPEAAVDNAYHMAEQLLANQRKFTEDLLKAMAPLMPGRSAAAPKVRGHQVWQEAVAEPKPVAISKPKPVAVSEPKPVAVSEPKPVAVSEPKPVAVSEPKPVAVSKPKPVAVSESKPPVRPAAKSTATRTRTAKSTAAKSTTAKSTTAKSTLAKSTAAKSTAAKSSPNTPPAGPAPKG
jgi:hypothetical protein